MSVFTEAELRYLAGGRQLGRIATVGADGTPHVVPVAFIYNAVRETIDIGGHELESSKKFRDVERTGRAAIVVDDLASTDPWHPRGIEIRGRGEAIALPTPLIRIHPERIVSWGIGPRRSARSVGTGCKARRVFAFDDALRSTVSANLAAHERREHPLDGRRHAAVAVVVVDSDAERDDGDPIIAEQIDMSIVPGDVRDHRGRRLDGRMVGVAGGAAFLLCRRAARLNRHAGQWALPGGRIDDGETALDAALRELDEELGMRLGPESVVGWLDDYPTRSGYVITPVVVWGGADPQITPAPDEVLAVYRIGLHALADSEPRFIDIPESDRPVLQVPLGNDLIHAPTGAVLYQFQQVGLLGNAGKRVDDLEQPVFAWR